MGKTTKAQRKALEAIDHAEAAAKNARKVAKTLPGKNARKLREVAGETIGDVDVSKKALRKNPGKIAKRAHRAEDRVRKATRAAVAKAEEKARLRAQAERAAAEAAKAAEEAKTRAAEAKALKKAAAKADRAAARAEREALEADRLLEQELAPARTETDAAAGANAPAPDSGAKAPAVKAPAVKPAAVKAPAVKPAAVKAPAVKPAAAKTPAPRASTAKTPARIATSTSTSTTTRAAAATAPSAPTRKAGASAPADLSALTVAQLRDRARATGRTGYSRLSKAQLIALLS